MKTIKLLSTESESLETWDADILISVPPAEDSHAPKIQTQVQPKAPPASWSLIIGAKQSVFCLATSRNHADQVLHRLKTSGFPSHSLSALFPDNDPEAGPSPSKHRSGPPGVLARTAWWAARRSGFGTIAALTIPGAGSFVVVGPIIAALNGGTTGGVVDRLRGIGIPEIEATRYEGRIKQGQILISVHAENPDEIARAKAIFMETGAQDFCTLGEASPKDSSGTEYASRPAEAAHSHTRPQLWEHPLQPPPGGLQGNFNQ